MPPDVPPQGPAEPSPPPRGGRDGDADPTAPQSPGPSPGPVGGGSSPLRQSPSGSAGFYAGRDDAMPERIGAYRVVRRLASGGMGVVYLAVREEEQFHRRVAIKVIRRGMDTDEVLRRFHQERQLLAAMNHPNIARLLDGGATDDGRPYFVMEYIEGKPLLEHCEAQRLSVEDRLRLFQDVCSAVQYAHRNLIVHRDIKPGNILVTAEGAVKLLDFGIAKLLNPELSGAAPDPTATDLRLMTPEYASPEQVKGEAITTASDVYSLGVVLYELLTGRRPYRLKSRLMQEIVRIVCTEEPERPSTAVTRPDEPPPTPVGMTTAAPGSKAADTGARRPRPERLKRRLEGDLDNIVMMAMRKEPQRRYQSAEQLAEDIRRHLEDRPVTARPERPLYVAMKFARRNKAGVAAATAVMLALSAGLGAALWSRGVAVAERRRAEDATARATQAFGALEGTALLAVDAAALEQSIDEFQSDIAARVAFIRDILDRLQKVRNEIPVASKHLAFAAAMIGGRLGDVQGGRTGPNIGDTAAAADTYKRAAADLADSRDVIDPVRYALALASLERRRADAAKTTDLEKAIAHQRAALDALRPLLTRADAKPAVRRSTAQAMLDFAASATKQQRFAEAFSLYGESIALRRALSAETYPDEPTARRDLAVGLLNYAEALRDANRPAEAFPLLRESNALREQNLADEPDLKRARRDLWSGRLAEARLLSATGEHAKAAEILRRQADEILSIAALDTTDSRPVRDAASTFEALGDALADSGDRAGAVKAYERMAEQAERMANLKRSDAPGFAASAASRTGNAMLASGDVGGALQRLSDAAERFDVLAKKDRHNAGNAQNAALARRDVGHARRAVRDFAGADEAYAAAERSLRTLADASPNAATPRIYLGGVLADRAFNALDAGRRADALRGLREAVALLDQTVSAASGDDARSNLAYALAGLALAELEDKAPDRAREAASRAGDLVQNSPAKPALVLWAQARAAKAAGDPAAASLAAEARKPLADAPDGSPYAILRARIDADIAAWGAPAAR